jgi:hypothetical protein
MSRRQTPKHTYRVTFLNQGKLYEIYARSVSHGELFGFVEVADIVFGERTQVVVDPSEESLKLEFAGVARTFIPLHSVVRIDEVLKEGTARITEVPKTGTVTAFPTPIYTPGRDPGKP